MYLDREKKLASILPAVIPSSSTQSATRISPSSRPPSRLGRPSFVGLAWLAGCRSSLGRQVSEAENRVHPSIHLTLAAENPTTLLQVCARLSIAATFPSCYCPLSTRPKIRNLRPPWRSWSDKPAGRWKESLRPFLARRSCICWRVMCICVRLTQPILIWLNLF